MGPGTKENLRRIRQLEAEEKERESLRDGLDGWDKCHIPVKDIFRYDDKPENCPACGGFGTKRSEKRNEMVQYMACTECGARFVRPFRSKVIVTIEEVEI